MRIAMIALAMALAAGSNAKASTRTFTCTFQKFANENGVQIAREPMVLRFLVDDFAHTAYVLGDTGSSLVEVVRHAEGGSTFIETTTFGTVQVTAVSVNGKAVHSRHTLIKHDFVASQSYGACVVK